MKTRQILLTLTATAAMLGVSGCYYYPPPPPAMVTPGPGLVIPAPSIVVPVGPYRYYDDYRRDDHRRYPGHYYRHYR